MYILEGCVGFHAVRALHIADGGDWLLHQFLLQDCDAGLEFSDRLALLLVHSEKEVLLLIEGESNW